MAFGVPRLDHLLSDEDPGQALLVRNEPGVDAQPFLLQAARAALAAGRHVVYMSTDRAPGRVIKAFEKAGIKTDSLFILDAHSLLFSIPDPDHPPIDPSNIADVVSRIDQAATEHPGALFVLDSLNGLVLHTQMAHLVAAAPRLSRSLQRFPGAVVSYTFWHEEVALAPLVKSFPHSLHLSAVHDRIATNHYFRLERISGRSAQPPPTLYRSQGLGPLQVYIPKVVVTGPAGAGKSTFVHQVCDHAVSAEQQGVTVALDRGAIDQEGLRVEMFGMPGEARFDSLMEPIMANAVAVVLVVDATDPDSFERASYMLQGALDQGIQVIVAANKQDLEGALGPEEVGRRIGGPAGTDVLPCIAVDKANADLVMQKLVDRILSPQVTV